MAMEANYNESKKEEDDTAENTNDDHGAHIHLTDIKISTIHKCGRIKYALEIDRAPGSICKTERNHR